MSDEFANDVADGLGAAPKTLPSKYFYDAAGDDLFIQIMDLPEYYLTRAEMEIFREQTDSLIKALGQSPEKPFELVELGAGDGQKTFHLLKKLLSDGYNFTYVPVDISANVLEHLKNHLTKELPDLKIRIEQGDYFKRLKGLQETAQPRVILYLGSNLGNLTDEKSKAFMEKLSRRLTPGDRLVLGVDKKKSADIVLPAYNDSKGVTAAFNLNLLKRINSELGGEFDLAQFRHAPEYDEENGIAISYIESLADQDVEIKAIDQLIHFAKGEKIKVEISRKYDLPIIRNIIADTPFEIETVFQDSQEHFFDIVLLRN
ncbi:L-histidine N(alpha)-methyltransferase [Litorimonas sp.]|uniref:L-histidine N(alpha)-methyltransferase n=1 Tax=Litorimonas sp. TaxID=1892381 RepID=UPI003A8A4E26